MSAENVEAVRRAYANDVIAASSDADIWAEYCHPDAELVPPGIYPDTESSYRGFEGFRRFQEQLDEIWDDWRVEAERIFDAGDEVVVFVRNSATAKQSGAYVTASAAHLLAFRDGRVARVEIFLKRREALSAAGLAE